MDKNSNFISHHNESIHFNSNSNIKDIRNWLFKYIKEPDQMDFYFHGIDFDIGINKLFFEGHNVKFMRCSFKDLDLNSMVPGGCSNFNNLSFLFCEFDKVDMRQTYDATNLIMDKCSVNQSNLKFCSKDGKFLFKNNNVNISSISCLDYYSKGKKIKYDLNNFTNSEFYINKDNIV